jgi:hypothetical protein
VNTIWGKSDSIIRIKRGLSWVNTPSHGGFAVAEGYAHKHLSISARQRVEFRNGYFWFEEDCDYAIVMFELHDLFRSTSVTEFPINVPTKEVLIKSLSHWHADYLVQRGVEPDAEGLRYFNENKQSDRMRADKSPDLIVSAFGDWADWVPSGKVGLQTADGKRYLAPSSNYQTRNLNLLSQLLDVQPVSSNELLAATIFGKRVL